jgi:hypothetical protein
MGKNVQIIPYYKNRVPETGRKPAETAFLFKI